MKFRIRFADQIVGVFIILTLVCLVFVLFMLGKSQRWFAQDATFRTELSSATGLSRNMAVLYKGFTIGSVRSFYLGENDQVVVSFLIYEEYLDRVREGSLVELVVSPVGLGNQFLFHPGKGQTALPDESLVPAWGTDAAQALIARGLADDPQREDSISLLLSRVSAVADSVNQTLTALNAAIGEGTDESVIGQILASLQRSLAEVETMPGALTATIDELRGTLDEELARINPILADVNTLSSKLADPEGAVARALDPEEAIYTSLTAALESVSGILASLDETARFLPRQLPQIAALVTELRTTLKSAEEVLVALTNNPLLKDGVPKQSELKTVNTGSRGLKF